MNQLCKVCGEPAAGFHFGAFTCEGCKSFFGRTYNNISSISECKNNGKCVINKKNRTACKACRLRKCMMVGMSKSGSRYGRRSNWFKIHCLLQQQQQQQVQQQNLLPPHPGQIHTAANVNLAAAASLLRPNPYLSPLFRNHPAASASGRENASNSESDSGASSADPEDDVRSGSVLSYMKPSASPLSDRVSSDTDYFAKNRINNNNNNNSSKMYNVENRVSLPRPPSLSPASLPAISPNTLVMPNALVVSNHRWLPGPFPVIGDPAVWRELWLRGQPTLAAPAPDQDQPIDLSVKQGPKTMEVTVGEDSKEEHKDIKEGEGKPGIPLDLTLSER
ncbi:uncharacterized protein LOC143204039 isoform X2 [Rhynchophorus ferrugineus]